jgi:signal-transduction protein with cAMP-binding, CBS, and nucleotidyltransferase domain
VREGGLLALAAADPRAAMEALPALAADPDATVSRHSRAVLARLSAQALKELLMYSTAEKILVLKSSPVFDRLNGEDLAPLARVAEVESVPAGQPVFKEGDPGDALYVVIRGKIAISCKGLRLSALGPGEAFGEMGALESTARSATATADEETEVLRIGSEEFYEALHEQVELAEGIIHMLARRLREADAARLHDAGEAKLQAHG